jgi:hypothetical protein
MEAQCTSGRSNGEEFLTKLIMQSDDLTNGLRREPLKEPTQRRFVRPLLQSQEGTEKSIVLELVSLADPLHSGDEQEQK